VLKYGGKFVGGGRFCPDRSGHYGRFEVVKVKTGLGFGQTP